MLRRTTAAQLVSGRICRKKNLEASTCYEFRVRAVVQGRWSGCVAPHRRSPKGWLGCELMHVHSPPCPPLHSVTIPFHFSFHPLPIK